MSYNYYTDAEIEKALSYLSDCYQDVALHCEENEVLFHTQKDLIEIIEENFHNFTGRQLQLLFNDVLLPIEQDWWKPFYTKSVYHQEKKIVMRKFFDCLNR